MSAQPLVTAVADESSALQVVAPRIVLPTVRISEAMRELIRLRENVTDQAGLDRFLKWLVEDTRLLLCGSGSAVALGGEQTYHWRARCGEVGPAIGTRLMAGSSISGRCLLSGEVQLCGDTANDPRVDAELCRQLGLGSMIAVPIKRARRVEGILEAWSGQAQAFDGRCADVLQELADLAADARERSLGLQHRVIVEVASISFRFAAVTSSSPEMRHPSPAISHEKPALLGQTGMGRLKEWMERSTVRLKRASAELSQLFITSRTEIVLACLFALIPSVAWYNWNSKTPPTPVPESEQAEQLASLAMADTARPAPLSPPPIPAALTETNETEIEILGAGASMENSKPGSLMAVSRVRQTLPAVSDDTPRRPLTPAKSAANFVSEGTNPASSLLSFSLTPQELAYRKSTALRGGDLRVGAPPAYPSYAKSAGIEGTVTVEAMVDERGHVESLKVTNGPPALARATIDAVKHWQFEPYILDARPVKMSKMISVRFRLQ